MWFGRSGKSFGRDAQLLGETAGHLGTIHNFWAKWQVIWARITLFKQKRKASMQQDAFLLY